MKGPQESNEEAKKKTQEWIEKTLSEAVDLICSGDTKKGMFRFGQGQHAQMDVFSPEHRDKDDNPFVWKGLMHVENSLPHIIRDNVLRLITRPGYQSHKKGMAYAAVAVAENLRELKSRVCEKCPTKAPAGWCDTCPPPAQTPAPARHPGRGLRPL
jgi:hypothetical protein